MANLEGNELKSDSSCFNFNKVLLKYLIALCIGTAGLLSVYASMPLLQPKEYSFAAHGVVQNSIDATSLYLATVDTENAAGSTDIADILKENPALLCPVSASSSFDAMGHGAENHNADNRGSILGLRGLNKVCPPR